MTPASGQAIAAASPQERDAVERRIRAFADAGWVSASDAARAEALAESTTLVSGDALDEATKARVRPMVDDGLRGLAPLVQVGMHPAGKLRFIADLVAGPKKGPYRQHVVVIEPDLERFAAACSEVDLTDLTRSEWFTGFVGPDAVERFEGWLGERIAYAAPGAMSFARDGDAERGVLARVQEAAKRVGELQAAYCREQAERVAAIYRGRSAIDTHTALKWKARGGSMRILLVTSSRTSYLRRAFEDLRASLEADGHRVGLICEPTAADTWVSGRVCELIADAEPDVVIASNFPRSAMREALPAGLPYVCWVQDMMTPLMSPTLGEETGEWDVFTGVNLSMLATRLGVGWDRMMASCVPASGRKFHPRAVDAERRGRFACEVAFVSNHGETPEAMRDRLASLDGSMKALVHEAYERAQEIVERACERDPLVAADEATASIIEKMAGRSAQGAETERIKHASVAPMAARMFRHRTLAWVAEVCERRGWSFKLFGAGWEGSAFERFARGPVEHGEDLRACYQCAAAHLHLDINLPLHQRTIECVLSGGLPIVRMHAGMERRARTRAEHELLLTSDPSRVEPDGTRVFELGGGSSGPRVERLLWLRERLGMDELTEIGVAAGVEARDEATRTRNLVSQDAEAFFDGYGELGFVGPLDLERSLDRAINDPAWREGRSLAMEQHARAHLTTDVFARRLVSFVASAIGARTYSEAAMDWVRFGVEHGYAPPGFGMSPDDIRKKYLGG